MKTAERAAAGGRPPSPDNTLRRGVTIAAAALGLSILGTPATANDSERAPLRVCADQDNLPFTSNSTERPGFYMELARHLADTLKRPLEPVWASTYVQKRMLRTTLLAHKCDMFFGVPFLADDDGRRVVLSSPLIQVGYALVTPTGSAVRDLKSLAGKRVAVQFGTPVQAWMAVRDDVEAVTVTSPEEGMQALERGRADAGLLWGPSAGYLNTTAMGSRYRVTPLGEPVQWSASAAFAPDNKALRDEVDGVLARAHATIRSLALKYGFPIAVARPDGGPLPIHKIADKVAEAGKSGSGFDEDLQIPPVSKGEPLAPSLPRQKQAPAGEGATGSPEPPSQATDKAAITAGRDLFNSTCAHCHGPDAIQADRRINLRLLGHRYGSEIDKVFMFTVTHGRPEKGMPNWSGAFSDAQFKTILAFLKSVQE